LSQPYLDPEQTEDDYFSEFMANYRRAKVPIGKPMFLAALETAKTATTPPQVVEVYSTPTIHLLARLCRELQRLWGDEPFPLSCRHVAPFLGVTFQTANKWLRGLEGCGFIKTVVKGSEGAKRASQFRYLLPLV